MDTVLVCSVSIVSAASTPLPTLLEALLIEACDAADACAGAPDACCAPALPNGLDR